MRMKKPDLYFWGFIFTALLLGLPSYFAWFRSPFLVTYHEFDFFLGQFTPIGVHSPESLVLLGYLIYMALMLGQGWCYYRILLGATEDPGNSQSPLGWKTCLLAVAPVFFYVPWFSPDVFFYFGTGWIQSAHHFDPYARIIADAPDFPQAPVYLNVLPSWKYITTPYGPWFVLLMRGLVQLTQGNVFLSLFVLKGVFTGLHLLNMQLARGIARELNMNERATALCFLFNPVLLLCYIGCCHNDILLLSLGLGSVLFLLRKNHVVCFALLALGAGYKYVPILMVPCFLVFFMRGEWQPRSLLKAAGLMLLFTLLTLTPSLFFPKGISNFIRLLLGRDQLTVNFLYILPTAFLVNTGLIKMVVLKMALKSCFVVIYGMLLLRLLGKQKGAEATDLFSTITLIFLFYFTVGSPEIHEWYVGWFLIFIFWINQKRYFLAGLILSVGIPTLVIWTGPRLGICRLFGWVGVFFLLWFCLHLLLLNRKYSMQPSPLFGCPFKLKDPKAN